jgi:hypothetical protein
MPDALDDLRRYVGRGATVSESAIALCLTQFTCKAKVNQLNVSVRPKHNILRLQVSVDNVST